MSDDLWLEVIAAAEERRQKGLHQYGRPVTADGDLDWLEEAEAEALDFAVYLRAARRRWEQTQRELDTLRVVHQSLCNRYAADSPNGDLLDWLWAWLSGPPNESTLAILAAFLAKGGYDYGEATRLLRQMQGKKQ